MKKQVSEKNVITTYRLNLFLVRVIEALEKQPELSKKIKTIKGRTKIGMIEISKDADEVLKLKASQAIVDAVVKAIKLLDVKGSKSRITADLIKEAEEVFKT